MCVFVLPFQCISLLFFSHSQLKPVYFIIYTLTIHLHMNRHTGICHCTCFMCARFSFERREICAQMDTIFSPHKICYYSINRFSSPPPSLFLFVLWWKKYFNTLIISHPLCYRICSALLPRTQTQTHTHRERDRHRTKSPKQLATRFFRIPICENCPRFQKFRKCKNNF